MPASNKFLLAFITISIVKMVLATFLLGQEDTIFFCDFENVSLSRDSNNFKHISTRGGVFEETLPHSFSNETFNCASPYSYKTIEYGTFNVGHSFIHHSPTWYPYNNTKLLYNHLELKLDDPLLPGAFYKMSFLIGNFKSHKYKLSHYGVKFSKEEIIKDKPGTLLSHPNFLFPFNKDIELEEIQAIVILKDTCSYIYFGAFIEDSIIKTKDHSDFNQHNISDASHVNLEREDSNLTRVLLDNILIEKTGQVMTSFDNIYFEINGYTISSKENFEILSKVAEYLRVNPKIYVLLEGYTDTSGSISYNLELSEKRAEEIKRNLILLGVANNRIVTIGHGINYMGDKNAKYDRKVSFTFFY